MAAVMDPPVERVFGGGAEPPVLPPDGAGGTPEPDKDHCPRCGHVKAAVCACGYDWDNWRWTDGA